LIRHVRVKLHRRKIVLFRSDGAWVCMKMFVTKNPLLMELILEDSFLIFHYEGLEIIPKEK